jgi:hypothetical protein
MVMKWQRTRSTGRAAPQAGLTPAALTLRLSQPPATLLPETAAPGRFVLVGASALLGAWDPKLGVPFTRVGSGAAASSSSASEGEASGTDSPAPAAAPRKRRSRSPKRGAADAVEWEAVVSLPVGELEECKVVWVAEESGNLDIGVQAEATDNGAICVVWEAGVNRVLLVSALDRCCVCWIG